MKDVPVDVKRRCPAVRKEVFNADGGSDDIEQDPGVCQPRGPWPGERSDTVRLAFACPGCARWGSVRVGHPKPEGAVPSWDIVKGSVEKPETLTLAPSINCTGCCGWHGYLRDGVFVPC